ncbi:MAG TPA: glycosyltransferase family 2 protein [Spirochaetota bacterium]|nr:glycosyltransferase family 2 protein [Spirochaetota bacterium]
MMPAYNEGSGIRNALKVIDSIMKKNFLDYEFLIIDDGSSDDTWANLLSCRAKYPLRAVKLSRNFGKEAAIRAGLEKVRTSMVVLLDSDLQHPPVIIPEMIEVMARDNADVVDGIRDDRGKESFFNRIVAGCFYRIFSCLTGIDLQKASDFKLMNRKAIDAYLSLHEKALFFRGMSAWIGYKRSQVIFKTDDRIAGHSKWSTKALFRLAKNAIVSFSTSLLHLPMIFGVVFCFISLFVSAESIFRKLYGHSIEGFPTIIVLLGLVGGLILISLGVIGEYLAKIYEEVKMRPVYLVGEEISNDKKK